MRVAVLRGGPSDSYNESIESGALAIAGLRDTHEVSDIYIDKEGVWHRAGLPIAPERFAPHSDLFLNMTHGQYGEDGRVQKIMARAGVAYSGPRPMAAANAYRKDIARKLLTSADLPMPEAFIVRDDLTPTENALEIFRRFGGQYIIKPIDGSFSRGIRIAREFNDLGWSIALSLEKYSKVIVEEFLRGVEIKCVVIEGFRGSPYYTLLPVEIKKESVYNIYGADGFINEEHIIPARVSKDEADAVARLAISAHRVLGQSHYSSVDMILTRRGLFVLEVDALPPLGPNYHLSQALRAVGATLPEFLNHVVANASASH